MSILLISGCNFSYVGCVNTCLSQHLEIIPIQNKVSNCKEFCKTTYP